MMRLRLLSLAMLSVVVAGCGDPDAASKASLYEHDHAVAEHWPDDLANVSVKLRERLTAPEISASSLAEITDLVSWTAEVAADTNLAEADWVPLYDATESLMAKLRSSPTTLTPQHREAIESLCELIDDTSEKIPDQLPNLGMNPS